MNMPPALAMDMLARLYRRSLSKGLEFDLDMDWIYRNVDAATVCYYSGDNLVLPRSTDNGVEQYPNARTIDRVDCNIGYTKDNCVICSFKYNQLKELLFESGQCKPQAVFKMCLKTGGII